LRGLTIKEAGTILEKLGLHLSPVGTGLAVRQDVAPGSKVARDTTITVEFEPPDIQVLRD
jgi:stage V sporulation protein D (sporulation-specific penicillin-binding protein)